MVSFVKTLHSLCQCISLIDIDECLDNNGWCSQLCTNTNGNYTCSCSSGYQFSSDGISCDGGYTLPYKYIYSFMTAHATCSPDINECSDANMCEQLCRNTVGSYMCSCASGYILSGDNVTCTKAAEATASTTTTSAVIGAFAILIAVLIILEAAYLYMTRCHKKRKVLEAANGIVLSMSNKFECQLDCNTLIPLLF